MITKRTVLVIIYLLHFLVTMTMPASVDPIHNREKRNHRRPTPDDCLTCPDPCPHHLRPNCPKPHCDVHPSCVLHGCCN
jgi:hypothetical protein